MARAPMPMSIFGIDCWLCYLRPYLLNPFSLLQTGSDQETFLTNLSSSTRRRVKNKFYFVLFLWVPLYSAEAVTQVLNLGTILKTNEEAEEYLQFPWSMDIDDQGRILVADVLARKIFVWDANGEFLTTFGKQGKGPGEFMFTGRHSGGYQAYVAAYNKRVYVYDGSERRLNIFDENFQFQKAVSFKLSGRTESFFVTQNEDIVLFQRNYSRTVPSLDVACYNLDGELKQTLNSQEDTTFSRITENGKIRNIVYHAYSPTTYLHYDRSRDELLFGNTGIPAIQTHDVRGNHTASIPLEIVPARVSTRDRMEYGQQFWLKNSKFLKADYPDHKAYFDMVLPLGPDHFFVYYQSPVEKRIEGRIIDRQGRLIGKKVNFVCGEGGGLFGARGRIMVIRLDENDDYNIQELSLPRKR